MNVRGISGITRKSFQASPQTNLRSVQVGRNLRKLVQISVMQANETTDRHTHVIDPAGVHTIYIIRRTADATVPYSTAPITLLGFFYIQIVHGSEAVHQQADRIGLDHCFHTYVGEDHTPHVFDNAHLDTTIAKSASFLHGLACNTGVVNCDYYVAQTGFEDGPLARDITVYPNPASQALNVELPKELNTTWNLEIFDMVGARVKNIENLQSNYYTVERNGLPSGMYVLRITAGKQQYQTKFLFD